MEPSRRAALAVAALPLLLGGCPRHQTPPDAGGSGGIAAQGPTAQQPTAPGAIPPPPVIPGSGAIPPSAPPPASALVDFSAMNAAAAGKKPAPDCTPIAGARRYDVGSKAIPSLEDVPWTGLNPGDVVCVPYRAEPYHSKIFFLTRGAPGAPIRLVGLRGPRGERPIIDGDGAKSARCFAPPAASVHLEAFGVINMLSHLQAPPRTPWGWHPGWITITGLKIQHARPASQFTDSTGAVKKYAEFSAAIYINPADNVIIEDCDITDSQIGVFAKTFEKTPNQLDRVTENLTLRGNYFHDNGDEKSLRLHNVYIEGRGCNAIGNYFRHKPGMKASNYKTRCAHDRVYGNWLVGGFQSLLKFVDPQSGWDSLGTAPDFDPAVVAGNVLVDPADGGTYGPIVHFGGDSYSEPTHYRHKLIFYANTVVATLDGHTRPHVAGLYHFTKEEPSITAWLSSNVVFDASSGGRGRAGLSLTSGTGTAVVSHDWIGPSVPFFDKYEKNPGKVTGWDGSPSGADPGLRAAEASTGAIVDLRPAKGSPLVDKGEAFTALPAESGASSVKDFALYEFMGTPEDPWYRVRAVSGEVDIGAYEAAP